MARLNPFFIRASARSETGAAGVVRRVVLIPSSSGQALGHPLQGAFHGRRCLNPFFIRASARSPSTAWNPNTWPPGLNPFFIRASARSRNHGAARPAQRLNPFFIRASARSMTVTAGNSVFAVLIPSSSGQALGRWRTGKPKRKSVLIPSSSGQALGPGAGGKQVRGRES